MNSTCDNKPDDIIKLSTWLFVNAGTITCVVMFYIMFLILFINKKQYKFVIMTLIIFVFNCLFTVIWNILGGVELFKNSPDCRTQSEPLWIMVLISLICQWVGLLLVCVVRKCQINNILDINNDNNDNDTDNDINAERQALIAV